jgi:hypothetical protein
LPKRSHVSPVSCSVVTILPMRSSRSPPDFGATRMPSPSATRSASVPSEARSTPCTLPTSGTSRTTWSPGPEFIRPRLSAARSTVSMLRMWPAKGRSILSTWGARAIGGAEGGAGKRGSTYSSAETPRTTCRPRIASASTTSLDGKPSSARRTGAVRIGSSAAIAAGENRSGSAKKMSKAIDAGW